MQTEQQVETGNTSAVIPVGENTKKRKKKKENKEEYLDKRKERRVTRLKMFRDLRNM